MSKYKYLDQETIERVAADVDREFEEMDRTARIKAWCDDPTNSQQLAQFRAEMQRAEEGHRAKYAPQRATQTHPRPAAPMGTPQNPIPANARFDPSHLKHQPVQIASIKDPYIR
jgi:hypothetical protein